MSHAKLLKSLADLEKRLTNQPYLCGHEITIADLAAAHELDQGKLVALDLSKYPKTADWLNRVIDLDPVSSQLVQGMRKSSLKTTAWLRKQEGYPKL